MKILTFTTLYPNSVETNHGIFIQNRLLDYIRCYGHELQVVAPLPYFPNLPVFRRWHKFHGIPRQETVQGVAVHHPRYLITPKVGMMLYGLAMFLGCLGPIRRLQERFDFSVIDAHYLYPDAFAAILLGRVLRKPVIVSARGTDVHLYSRLRSIRPLLRFVLSEAAAVVAVCEALKQSIMGLGIPEEKIEVVGNGVDLTVFFPTDKRAARQRLGLPPDATILLSIARLARVKGIESLISAVAQMRESRPGLELLVVGGESEPSYGRQLREQVKALQMNGAVRFVDPQPHAELRHWYNACDVFCLPSQREGWPNVLLEAMACGKPVVARRVGGIPEIVSSEELGVLVEGNRPEDLAVALDQALEIPWKVEAPLAHAVKHSWKNASARQQELFLRVLSGHKAGAG